MILEFSIFVPYYWYYIIESVAMSYLALPTLIIFCYPVAIFSLFAFSMYPLMNFLATNPTQIGKKEEFYKQTYDYCCNSETEQEFNLKLIVANYVCIKTYFHELLQSDDEQYFEFCQWLSGQDESDLHNITINEFHERSRRTIYQRILSQISNIITISKWGRVSAEIIITKGAQIIMRSFILILFIVFDVFLGVFESGSVFMQIYRNVIIRFGTVGIVLFCALLGFFVFEVFISKWNRFCFNMITTKHPKFILLKSPQDFIQNCVDIYNKNKGFINEEINHKKSNTLTLKLSNFYEYLSKLESDEPINNSFVISLLEEHTDNSHVISHLTELIAKVIQAVLVLICVILAQKQGRNYQCNVNSNVTFIYTIITIVMIMILNIAGIAHLYMTDNIKLYFVKMIHAGSFSLFLSEIVVYFYMFHFIGNAHCKYEYLWVLAVVLMFFGCTLTLIFWTVMLVVISWILSVIFLFVVGSLGLMTGICYPIYLFSDKYISCNCVSSKHAATDKDRQLNEELTKQKKKNIVKKLLLLGSGLSGKSTIFKQLRTIHGTGWSKEDRLTFIDHIHAQIIEQMKLSIECIEFLREDELIAEFGDDWKRPDDYNPFDKLSDDAQRACMVLQSVKDPKLNHAIADACKVLWNEPEIKAVYDNRATMKIADSCPHFWDKIDTIMEPGYVPDEMDILLVNYRTTGVIDQKFTIKKNIFHVFDTGGQKSERKKWIHCFEHVTAVIFVVSLSQYDEVMFEDEGVNCMVDNLQLFENICNNEWFEKSSMILFLNKKDLFAEKLKENKPITLCAEFASYDGNQTSFDETTSYIKNAFVEKNKSPDDKSIFVHLTCAIDKNNIEKVFNDVQHLIIENSLISAGLMGDFGES
eukprot:246140_1